MSARVGVTGAFAQEAAGVPGGNNGGKWAAVIVLLAPPPGALVAGNLYIFNFAIAGVVTLPPAADGDRIGLVRNPNTAAGVTVLAAGGEFIFNFGAGVGIPNNIRRLNGFASGTPPFGWFAET